MQYRLVHLTGQLAGRVRELGEAEVVLGRDPQASQIVFGPEERLVSRRHALLRDEGGVLLLQDLDSTTGTFVDGESISEAELGHGDVFELGPGGPRLRVERSDGGTQQIAALPPVAGPAIPRPAARLGPGSRLRLRFLAGSRKGSELELTGAAIRIGRAPGSTVQLADDRVVSAHHAKIVRVENEYVLLDLDSTNGTYLNGQRVERAALREHDVIGLGPGGPEIEVEVLAGSERDDDATVIIPDFARFAAAGKSGSLVAEAPLSSGETLVLGRDAGADLVLDSPIVSRRHARFTLKDTGLEVEDLGSANGTFVAGTRISSPTALSPGDRVVLGPFQVDVAAGRLRLLDLRHRARLEANRLTVRAGGRTLLHDISLTLTPGSFTAVIGPSGSGKSTLLAALAGVRPAQQGRVLLNGADLYRGFDALKTSLAYVPQDDIVHGELSPAESLGYTARLRLPRDTSAAERDARIASVLAMLELTERRDVRIGRLSGGQRKRVSIANEMLTDPGLLFLDEPTSGLDPALEEALMLLLRELAYKGKTVVLVTHTLSNIHLCDAVALLVEGRLAFHGTPEQAKAHFGIDPLVNLYARIKEKPAAEWAASAAVPAAPGAPSQSARPQAPPARGPADALRQLVVLTSRYATTLGRDGRNLSLLLLQAPLIAGLIGLSLLYGQSDIAYTKPKNTLLFLLALTSVWFGCSNAVREIVKERAIYLRERMANLGLLPYVASKLVVLWGLSALQCAAFLGILHVWFGIPGRPWQLGAAVLLISLVGILLGLTVSALAGTADRAMSLLPIVLIPQVLFTSPAVQMDMRGPAGLVARSMPTWWGFDLLRRIAVAPDAALSGEATLARLDAGAPVLMTRRRFETLLQDGYMMFNYRSAIEITWTAAFPEALAARLRGLSAKQVDALVLGLFAGGLLTATSLLQKRRDRR